MDNPVCKHNQSGYCKHGILCHKRHENKVCPKNNVCNDMGLKCGIQKGVNILTLTTGVSLKTVPTLLIKKKIK